MISPYSQYPSSHQDVFASLLQGSQANNDLETARRQSELGKQAKEFSQRYALQGLQNQISEQSQRNNLMQSRMDGVYGPAGNLLRGLSN